MGLPQEKMDEYSPKMDALKAERQKAKEEHLRKLSQVLLPYELGISGLMHEMRDEGATLADLGKAYGTKNVSTLKGYLAKPATTLTPNNQAPQATPTPDNPWADYVTVEPLPEPNQDIAMVTVKRLPTALVPEGGAKWKWVKGYGGNKLPKAVDFQGKLMLVERDGMLKLYPLNAYLTRKRSAYAETPQGPEMVFADAKPGHPLYDMFIDAGVEPKPWGYVEK